MADEQKQPSSSGQNNEEDKELDILEDEGAYSIGESSVDQANKENTDVPACKPNINPPPQSLLSNGSARPSGNGGRFPSMAPSMAELGRIPTAPKNIAGNHKSLLNRNSGQLKYPNQMMKMPTVTMTNKSRGISGPTQGYYNNYVESRRPRKVITWDEATNARPPLRIDMEGPTPCTYSPRNKPLIEKNSPIWTFGRRSFVEKPGGSRTSWEKTWFQNPHVWTQKADFSSDKKWPSPPTHRQKPTLGKRLATVHAAPQHTFGYRREFSVNKSSEFDPGPNEYEIDKANKVILPQSPAYTHSLRHGGTCLWSYTETTPGPGRYKPETSYSRIKPSHPSFSIRGTRGEKSHALGPFCAF